MLPRAPLGFSVRARAAPSERCRFERHHRALACLDGVQQRTRLWQYPVDEKRRRLDLGIVERGIFSRGGGQLLGGIMLSPNVHNGDRVRLGLEAVNIYPDVLFRLDLYEPVAHAALPASVDTSIQ